MKFATCAASLSSVPHAQKSSTDRKTIYDDYFVVVPSPQISGILNWGLQKAKIFMRPRSLQWIMKSCAPCRCPLIICADCSNVQVTD